MACRGCDDNGNEFAGPIRIPTRVLPEHKNEKYGHLIKEGREFMANAISICKECDQLTSIAGIQQCAICGCLVKFKIAFNLLIKSKCPLEKW